MWGSFFTQSEDAQGVVAEADMILMFKRLLHRHMDVQGMVNTYRQEGFV